MVKPKIIIKDGKRYVKLGKKVIKVSQNMSEREFIKWLIEHFKPKKRKAAGAKKERTKATNFDHESSAKVVQNDKERIDLRETKEKLGEKEKELDRLKLAAAFQQSNVPQQQLPPGGGQQQLPPPSPNGKPAGFPARASSYASASSSTPAETAEDIRNKAIQAQKEQQERDRIIRDKENAVLKREGERTIVITRLLLEIAQL